MNDLNVMLAAVMAFAALGDLFLVFVPLRNFPSRVRLTMAGLALLLLVIAALLFTGTLKLI